MFDAASALFIAVGRENARCPVTQELLDAAKAYFDANQALGKAGE